MSAIATTNPNPNPPSRTVDRPTRYLLNAFWRKVVLVVHLIAGVAWMGVDLALLALLFTGLRTDDGATAAASYRAISIIVPAVVPALSGLIVASGLLLGWGTKWGVLRYWWVLVKLVLSLVMAGLVFVALTPEVAELPSLPPAAAADAAAVRAALGAVTTGLLFPPIVSFSMLLIAAILSQFKPWSRTPWTAARSR